MSKHLFIFLLISLSAYVYSQDTIFVKNREPLLVRVLEISKTEVSYKIFYNPDGIIYKLKNEEIRRIVYENGKEESRFQIAQKTNADPLTSAPSLFIIEEKHISYNNADIMHKDALKIMMKRNPQSNSDELNEALLNVEGKKNGQIAFTVLAPVCVVGGLYLARRTYYGPADRFKAKAFILSGIGLGVASFITAQIYKSVKNKHIRKAALLYNKEIL
jgi:hypothetical protein